MKRQRRLFVLSILATLWITQGGYAQSNTIAEQSHLESGSTIGKLIEDFYFEQIGNQLQDLPTIEGRRRLAWDHLIEFGYCANWNQIVFNSSGWESHKEDADRLKEHLRYLRNALERHNLIVASEAAQDYLDNQERINQEIVELWDRAQDETDKDAVAKNNKLFSTCINLSDTTSEIEAEARRRNEQR